MRHLEFTSNYERLLLSGKKRATIRKWTNLKPGDEVFVHCGGRIIGRARIRSVERKRIEDLSDEDAKLDGFESREELMEELKKLGYDGEVYVIRFDFEGCESIDPHSMYYGDADLEEIARKALQHLDLSERDRRVLELFLKAGSIRKTAARLGGWRKRGEVRAVLRKCYEALRERGLI